MCPALIKMYNHQTADTQNTTNTKEAHVPWLTVLCFLSKLFRKGVLGVLWVGGGGMSHEFLDVFQKALEMSRLSR